MIQLHYSHRGFCSTTSVSSSTYNFVTIIHIIIYNKQHLNEFFFLEVSANALNYNIRFIHNYDD